MLIGFAAIGRTGRTSLRRRTTRGRTTANIIRILFVPIDGIIKSIAGGIIISTTSIRRPFSRLAIHDVSICVNARILVRKIFVARTGANVNRATGIAKFVITNNIAILFNGLTSPLIIAAHICALDRRGCTLCVNTGIFIRQVWRFSIGKNPLVIFRASRGISTCAGKCFTGFPTISARRNIIITIATTVVRLTARISRNHGARRSRAANSTNNVFATRRTSNIATSAYHGATSTERPAACGCPACGVVDTASTKGNVASAAAITTIAGRGDIVDLSLLGNHGAAVSKLRPL